MVERQDWIEAQGWTFIIVHMEHDDALPPYLGNLPLRYVHHLNDPEGDLYKAFGLNKGRLGQLMGPQVIWRGLKSFLRGERPGKVGKDVRQMPGTFLVANGRIRSAYRSKDASDHPDLDAMAKEFHKDAP